MRKLALLAAVVAGAVFTSVAFAWPNTVTGEVTASPVCDTKTGQHVGSFAVTWSTSTNVDPGYVLTGVDPSSPHVEQYPAGAAGTTVGFGFTLTQTKYGEKYEWQPKPGYEWAYPIIGQLVKVTYVKDVDTKTFTGETTLPGLAECVKDVPPPPHVTTGSAGVRCDLPSQTYVLYGETDGMAADRVDPATLPGTTKGWTNVTVHRGDTSHRTAVFTYGDCVRTTSTPPAVTTTPPTTTTPSTPASPTTPAAQKPTQKPKAKPARKPAAKKPAPKVCKPLRDGTRRVWYPGGPLGPKGCKTVKDRGSTLTG